MKMLLLISQERYKPGVIDYCLKHLKNAKNAQFYAVYILDQEFSNQIEKYLSEATFIADRPGQELSDALNMEYEQRGKAFLQEICGQFHDAKISCQTKLVSGDFFEVSQKMVEEFEPDQVIVSEKKKSLIANLCGRSDIKKMRKRLSVPIKAF